MSKHAPGPWSTPTGLALSRHKAGKPIDCEIPVTAGERPIAFVSHYCAEEGMNARITERNRMEMQEANARLIAAAPELLEALKAMDREIMDLALYIDLENKVAAHACLDAIRAIQEAAIRKAEEQA